MYMYRWYYFKCISFGIMPWFNMYFIEQLSESVKTILIPLSHWRELALATYVRAEIYEIGGSSKGLMNLVRRAQVPRKMLARQSSAS